MTVSDPPSSSSPSVSPDSSEPPYSADAPSSDAPDREDQGPGAAQGPGRASADVEGAGDALPGDAVLRPMGWLDVPAVIDRHGWTWTVARGEIIALNRAGLRAELAAASGPAADRYYLVAERMPRMSGRGSAGAGADSALDGVNAPGGELLGYAGLWFGDGAGDADLLTIATLPAARRRGVATAMLARLVERARQAGCGAVLLEVRVSNTGAQALYRRHGFVPIGRRRRYYLAPVEDALVMRVDTGAHCAPGPAGPAELAGPVGPVGAEAVDADLRGGRMRRRGPGD